MTRQSLLELNLFQLKHNFLSQLGQARLDVWRARSMRPVQRTGPAHEHPDLLALEAEIGVYLAVETAAARTGLVLVRCDATSVLLARFARGGVLLLVAEVTPRGFAVEVVSSVPELEVREAFIECALRAAFHASAARRATWHSDPKDT